MRPDLAALVGSRICHDLISPLGAIGNGVELLGMTGVPDGPEMDLIAESVGNANARIRFFRIAFGAAAADQRIGAGRNRLDPRGRSRDGRIAYRWQAEGDVERRDVAARLPAAPMPGNRAAARRHDHRASGRVLTGTSWPKAPGPRSSRTCGRR